MNKQNTPFFMKKVNYLLISALALTIACNNTDKKVENKLDKQATKTEAPVLAKTFSQDDYTLFLGAALEDQRDIVLEKLAAGIDINYQDENKRTALMLASFNGHTELVKLFIAKGADVSLVDMTNRSALMFACTGPFLETVKLLLEAGSDVNATDSHESWTPVMFAAGEGQLEVVKALVEAGADISMVDVDGESSYDFALSRGHATTAAYLKDLAQSRR